jgi:hypothetical protein
VTDELSIIFQIAGSTLEYDHARAGKMALTDQSVQSRGQESLRKLQPEGIF